MPNLFASAISLLQSGHLEQAKQLFLEVTEKQPRNADAVHFLGLVYHEQGDSKQAILYMRKSIEINPQSSNYFQNLGGVLLKTGQIQEAIQCVEQALKIQPNNPKAAKTLKIALDLQHSSTQLKEINDPKLDPRKLIRRFQEELRTLPNKSISHYNLGTAYYDLDVKQAIYHLRLAIQGDPSLFKAHFNLANLLHKHIHDLDGAISHYKRALHLKPGYGNAWNNLGTVYQEQYKWAEALDCFERAIEIDSSHSSAQYNKGTTLLTMGQLLKGWEGYEWRHQCFSTQRNYARPLWKGEFLQGTTLFLYGEQGFGDYIQFIRYLYLEPLRLSKTIVECHPALTRLFSTIPGIEKWIREGDDPPSFDRHASLHSLPGIFKTELKKIPSSIPYLQVPFPDNGHPNFLPKNDHFKVGLVWSGNPNHINDHYRSIQFKYFLPFIHLSKIQFYSLQQGSSNQQIKEFSDHFQIINLSSKLGDFYDTAQLIQQLDLVISVDTAVAHLTGALGKPVWTLLPYIPDWRWMIHRADSPWYPTMRLYRQKKLGEWEPVIQQITKDLKSKRSS